MVDKFTDQPSPLITTSYFGTEYNGHRMWILCETVLAILTGLLVYVCSCLARFAWLVNTAAKKSMDNKHTASEAKMITDEGYRNRAKFIESCRSKYKRIMVHVSLIAALVTLAKFLLDQMFFFHVWNARSDELCEFANDFTSSFMGFCAFISVYGFLWMKQWIFYRDPAATGILYNRILVLFSRYFVVFLVVLSVVILVTNIIPIQYNASNSTAPMGDVIALANDVTYLGCVSIYNMSQLSDSWQSIWFIINTAVQQVLLLCLFIYPLIKHKRDAVKLEKGQRNFCSRSNIGILAADTSHARSETAFPARNSHAVGVEKSLRRPRCKIGTEPPTEVLSKDALKTIKRAIVWTAICEVSDISLFAVIASFDRGVPLVLVCLAHDIDLFINVICVVVTYNTWKNILFPWCAGDDVIGGGRPSTPSKKNSICTDGWKSRNSEQV